MEKRTSHYGFNKEVRNAFLLIVLVFGAYFAGTLWIRLQFLKGGSNTGAPVVAQADTKKAKDQMKSIAKATKLNERKFSSCLDNKGLADKIQKDVQLATTVGADGTPTFFIERQRVVGAQPWDVFEKAIEDKFAGKPVLGAAVGTDLPQPELTEEQWKTLLQNPVAVLGDAKAPVKIVEFTDYQCPFCKRAFDQTYPQLKSKYIDTGKVQYIVRDLPLSFHPYAALAAQAARCAGEQEKYWEMHDELFNKQQIWSGT